MNISLLLLIGLVSTYRGQFADYTKRCYCLAGGADPLRRFKDGRCTKGPLFMACFETPAQILPYYS